MTARGALRMCVLLTLPGTPPEPSSPAVSVAMKASDDCQSDQALCLSLEGIPCHAFEFGDAASKHEWMQALQTLHISTQD